MENAEVEFGREREEDFRESAAEVRREAAGEGGAGREEVSESREDLRPSRDDVLAESVGTVEEEAEGGEMMVVGGFWLLARGVVGGDSKRGTPSSSMTFATPFDPAPGGCMEDPGLSTDSDTSRAGGEAGTRPAPTPPLTLLREVASKSAP